MRFVSLLAACFILSSCGDLSLAELDDCTETPFRTVGCLTVKPVKYVAKTAGDAVGGSSSSSYSDRHSAKYTPNPKVRKPSKTFGGN